MSAQQSPIVQRCASDEHLQEQIRQNPERGKSLEALEMRVEKMLNAQKTNNPGKGGGGVPEPIPTITREKIFIPVVVHVVYNTDAENISDAQVKSQVKILNEDFTKTNTEILNGNTIWSGYSSSAGDSKIEFCLTKIVRKSTTVSSFSYSGDPVKKTSSGGSDPVNPTTHLNIWVSDLGSSLLGYAQFPGGNVQTDGVVVHYKAFGEGTNILYANYNLGRTATHEVGHWFGLRHIWGDRNCGDDKVSDTPLHDGANYGCGTNNETSTCKGKPIKMWMNYMDYTYDRCMYMFTNGQATRMDGFISASRSAYALSSCPAGTIASAANNANTSKLTDFVSKENLIQSEIIRIYPTLSRGQINIMMPSEKTGIVEVQLLNQLGSVIMNKRISVLTGMNNTSIDVSDFNSGTYFVRVIYSGKSQIQKIIIQQ